MDDNSPLKNHPIAIEMIRLVNVIGLNSRGEKAKGKKLQFHGIVKMVENPNVRVKVEMTGMKLSFNQKLNEMIVGLGCTFAAQNRCTFDGKINIKKNRVFEVARQVQIRKKFEAVRNVARNAVRYMQNYFAKRCIKIFLTIIFSNSNK